jgi:hypothetical protein
MPQGCSVQGGGAAQAVQAMRDAIGHFLFNNFFQQSCMICTVG